MPPLSEPASAEARVEVRDGHRASLARRIFDSLGNSAVTLLASLGAYVVIARFVAPAEYGRASIILATWGLASMTVDWSGTLLMRYGPVELGRDGTLRVTIATRLVFVWPALAATLPGALLYLGLARGWPALLLLLTVGWLVAAAAFSVTMWCAVAAQRFRALALANVLVRAAPPLVALTLVAARRAVSAEALVVGQVAGQALGAAVLIVALRPILGFARPDPALLRAMWRYCLPSLIAAVPTAAMSYVDPLILQRSVSAAEIGRYQLSYITVTVFGMVGASFNRVFSPELVRGDQATVERYRLRVQPRIAVGLGVLTIVGALVVAPLASVILPVSWAGSAETFAILTVAGGLMIGVWSYYPLVNATDSVWAMQTASIFSAATNVALDFAWAPRWGASGVAAANVAAWAVYLVALALLLHRRIHARRLALVPLLVAAAVVLPLVVAISRSGR
jgi:O-antigen/teichoic acid export membrane protein